MGEVDQTAHKSASAAILPSQKNFVEFITNAGAEKQCIDETATERPDRCTVLGCDIVKKIGERQPPRTRHVLWDEPRMTGQMATHEASKQPRVDVIGAAWTEADIDIDGPA